MTSEKSQPTEFQKFRDSLRKLVSIPKTEILRREKEYKEERARKRKAKK
jgi:hypothetical protein